MPSFGNVFGKDSRTFASEMQPVWISVDESKLSGGTVDVSGLSKGDLIPMALPVYLPKMGGTAQLIIGFSVKANVATTDTAVDFDWSASYGFKLKKGDIVGKINEATGVASKAAALGDYTEGTGFAITANDLGALTKGDLLYVISAAGSNKDAVLPNGLSRREIYIDLANPTYATVNVVTKGQILEDRIPAIPAAFKAALPGITFEKEL